MSKFKKVITLRGVRIIARPLLFLFIKTRINKYLFFLNKNINKTKVELESGCFNIAYVRSDFWIKNEKASGAIAHTKGVLEAFFNLGINIDVYSSYPLEYVNKDIPMCSFEPHVLSEGFNELQQLEYNRQFIKNFLLSMKVKPTIIYQRYGLNNFSGAYLAKKLNVPFILEYNGSEIWMGRQWGKKLRYEEFANKIEMLNFYIADLIIGNAESMKDEIIARGIDVSKITIIPNAVDESRFYPEIDGSGIREKLGLQQENIIVTFVGTYGPWHGAELLAQAIKRVCQFNKNVIFLFIGDGLRLNEVKCIISENEVDSFVKLTGIIPQLETPEYLAASDIFVSPQIPNPDGTPFFGSPTKLFEYMAMGKAIVASNLDQMGRILTHKETAYLVQPGNVDELVNGLISVINDEALRKKMGINARNVVLEKYTWKKHVEKIMEKLTDIVFIEK